MLNVMPGMIFNYLRVVLMIKVVFPLCLEAQQRTPSTLSAGLCLVRFIVLAGQI